MAVLDDAREMAGELVRWRRELHAHPEVVMTLEALSESLAARGADEFLFVGAPMNVRGATGAPIRPLAVTGT